MPEIDPNEHVLKQLVFPARYEALVERLGPEVVRLLISPEPKTREILEDAAHAVKNRAEGTLLPIYALSGTGKTTLANNLSYFFPVIYGPTVIHDGGVTAAELEHVTADTVGSLPANDTRIIPINIDHREGSPPSNIEVAELKRFLRTPNLGSRCIVVWPDTSKDVAHEISHSYQSIAGAAPVSIPIHISGPVRETWQDIATNTLKLSNEIESLEELGVDPRNYDPAESLSIGDYLRKISSDFTTLTLRMLRANQKQLRLVIVWASESSDAGVLVHLTSSTQFGLLDANALLDSTKNSVIGKWWSARRNLLTQAIVQLDARVFGLPPTRAATRSSSVIVSYDG